jgi:hypothetical protein
MRSDDCDPNCAEGTTHHYGLFTDEGVGLGRERTARR